MIPATLFVVGVIVGLGLGLLLSRRDWRDKAPCPHDHCRNRMPAPGLKHGGVYVGERCGVCNGAVKWNPRADAYDRVVEEEVAEP